MAIAGQLLGQDIIRVTMLGAVVPSSLPGTAIGPRPLTWLPFLFIRV
jgi:hypothetical protein